MLKTSIGIGVSAGLLSHVALAGGFVEDSHGNLTLRNFYINYDNRSGANNPSK